MINLIPNQEKKKKVQDFYFRMTVVSFFVLSACFVVAAAAVLPAYFLSSVRLGIAQERLARQNAEPVPELDQDTALALDELKRKIALIESKEQSKYLVSAKIINEVMLEKMADIKITKVFYEMDIKGVKKVTVNGVAPSRERLLLFRLALEGNAAFKKVDLPISNFVKGSNIQFSLNLTPA